MSHAPARTALTSVVAAGALVALKLVTGLLTGSLALVAEAAHSGADLVAAAVTLFAVRISGRPADREHPFGHGKAENLAALAEGTFLACASVLIAYRGLVRLVDGGGAATHAPWYAFAVLGVVLLIDGARAGLSSRAATKHSSPALAASAAHFFSDLAGSLAVLVGLGLVALGEPDGDSYAALVVAVVVGAIAAGLLLSNARVLMDTAPGAAEEAVRGAIEALTPPVGLRRLRLRQSAGSYFADVVIGVRADAGVGQGHAAAEAVERAVEAALPGTDLIVHVEPRDSESVRERVVAAAMSVRGVRELHNLQILETPAGIEISLHLKLPAEMKLAQAHELATLTEQAIARELPGTAAVHTHIEPLSAPGPASEMSEAIGRRIRELVESITGVAPLAARLRDTSGGAVVFLTIAADPHSSLTVAHAAATAVERAVRAELPELSDVVVHTEPAAG